MQRQWMTLDQIKEEYESNDYNPELLLQHLLHHVEASPASVPEVTDGMAIAFHNALTDGSIGQSEVDEIKTGLRAAIAAAPTPPENKALLGAVAEVVWYDPQLSHSPEKPGKIIDGSIAFMESAEIGTKLFAAPTPPASEDRNKLELYGELIYAVASKFPGESRHQTALRYILNAEKGSDNATMQEDKP